MIHNTLSILYKTGHKDEFKVSPEEAMKITLAFTEFRNSLYAKPAICTLAAISISHDGEEYFVSGDLSVTIDMSLIMRISVEC